MQYNTIHSLGSRCQNSEVLKHFGYREFSGFFDFMNTSTINNINHILADDFKELLKDENNISLRCDRLTIDPETGVGLPTSTRTTNKFYDIDVTNMDGAIFPHHDLNTEKDKSHFINCRQRFKKLINYNTLFNYTFNMWENYVTVDDMEKMVNSLKTVHNFKNFKVCFIGVKYGPLTGYENISTSEFYDVWVLTIANGSFSGGLFNLESDNQNYIDIIKKYDIADVRVSREEIDVLPTVANSQMYASWPIGLVPVHLQRPELNQVKALGYDWNDPRDIVDMFEKKVAAFAGSKYAVTVDCCSHGMFLSMKYLQQKGELDVSTVITVPKMTYVSAPMQVIHAGNIVAFEDLEWSGVYQLKPTRVWDGAVRWTKGMYVGGDAIQVVSFQIKKRIPIGKGGMILTDSEDAYNWFKMASYDGRDLTTAYTAENHVKMVGYHFYMTPEDAARGIILMDQTPEVNEDTGNSKTYVDVSKMI